MAMQAYRYIFLLISVLVLLPQQGLSEEDKKKDSLGQPVDPARQYAACVKLSESDPKQAYENANIWRAKGGGAAARHCGALALAAQQDYEGAALELEQMVDMLADGAGPTPGEGLAQAANAWLLAGRLDKARARIDEALKLEPEAVDFMQDRIRILAAGKDWDAVLTQVQAALKLDNKDAGLHVQHAAALRHLQRNQLAAEALAEAFARDGGSAAGLLEQGLIREQAGDLVGAKNSWQEAVDRFGPTLSAKAAAEHIDRLENPRPQKSEKSVKAPAKAPPPTTKN